MVSFNWEFDGERARVSESHRRYRLSTDEKLNGFLFELWPLRAADDVVRFVLKLQQERHTANIHIHTFTQLNGHDTNLNKTMHVQTVHKHAGKFTFEAPKITKIKEVQMKNQKQQKRDRKREKEKKEAVVQVVRACEEKTREKSEKPKKQDEKQQQQTKNKSCSGIYLFNGVLRNEKPILYVRYTFCSTFLCDCVEANTSNRCASVFCGLECSYCALLLWLKTETIMLESCIELVETPKQHERQYIKWICILHNAP